ncbi:MAG: PspC domain-containing protein [Candidatus Berkelbacteria bacterium]|nr:PspC domain-containing protein [Candidatus Berkelbacteria bacterium]
MDKKLYRSCHDRILGGVAGGLGQYFETDPSIIRLIFLILLFTGVGFLFYLIAWIVIPLDPECLSDFPGQRERNKEKPKAESAETSTFHHSETKSRASRKVIGGFIILLGICFFLESFFRVNIWSLFWPVALIVFGLALTLKNQK